MRLAVDFDGTLWHRHREGFDPAAVRVLEEYKALGWEVIVWTSRPDYTTPEIRALLDAHDVPYDFVLGGKLFYDLLIDDKARPWPIP
jgi:hydroxymethylpyrimidine pyrophosphatase-like HAD family hydrolase